MTEHLADHLHRHPGEAWADPPKPKSDGFPSRRQIVVFVGVVVAVAIAVLVHRFGFAHPLVERMEQASTCVELSALDDEYEEQYGDGKILSGDELADVGSGRSEFPEESMESFKAAFTIVDRGKELSWL